jgi:hypothetical protein
MIPYRENEPPKDYAQYQLEQLTLEEQHRRDALKFTRRANLWARIALVAAIVSGIAQLVGLYLRHRP